METEGHEPEDSHPFGLFSELLDVMGKGFSPFQFSTQGLLLNQSHAFRHSRRQIGLFQGRYGCWFRFRSESRCRRYFRCVFLGSRSRLPFCQAEIMIDAGQADIAAELAAQGIGQVPVQEGSVEVDGFQEADIFFCPCR